VRLPDEARREPHQDLVLDERVAELQQHLPARTALAEVLGAVGRRVEVELRMAPDERDHLVHAWKGDAVEHPPGIDGVEIRVREIQDERGSRPGVSGRY
jgi:hypothetical protein